MLTEIKSLAESVRELARLRADLAEHERLSAATKDSLIRQINGLLTTLNQTEAGLDTSRILLAEHVVFATDYSKGGDERGSARQDAIKYIATGTPLRGGYGDLRREYFGTKSYDRWHGQRSDHSYGMGPTHGSMIFRIGLTPEARTRDLTEEERDAAIYYLLNLEAIQKAKVAS